MTWQIVKILAPSERPATWEIPGHTGEEWFEEIAKHVWPFRTHKYVEALTAPVIYTYRHPIEAMLSFRSRLQQDFPKNDEHIFASAMYNMAEGWAAYKAYRTDFANGRPVLFLRYEDFYDEPEKRISRIADFMGVALSKEEIQGIHQETSLDINIQRGRAMLHHNPETPFSNCAGEETGMQRLHVNEMTMGQPGKWLEGYPRMVKYVRHPSAPAFEALKEMCIDMGYEV